MDWQDGLHDFQQSYKSPQTEQDFVDLMDWQDGLHDFYD